MPPRTFRGEAVSTKQLAWPRVFQRGRIAFERWIMPWKDTHGIKFNWSVYT